MSLRIESADGRQVVRLSGLRGLYVLRTSFSPFRERRFVDALDGLFRVERVRALEADGRGEWLGEFVLRVEPGQELTLAEDLAELMAEHVRPEAPDWAGGVRTEKKIGFPSVKLW